MKTNIKVVHALSAFTIALCIAQTAFAGETVTWPGTLYRNGGHFGEANSDESIENGQASMSEPPQMAETTSEAQSASPYVGASFEYYSGHRYRNGGYFGEENSDGGN